MASRAANVRSQRNDLSRYAPVIYKYLLILFDRKVELSREQEISMFEDKENLI